VNIKQYLSSRFATWAVTKSTNSPARSRQQYEVEDLVWQCRPDYADHDPSVATFQQPAANSPVG